MKTPFHPHLHRPAATPGEGPKHSPAVRCGLRWLRPAMLLLLLLGVSCDILEEDLSGRTARVIAPTDGAALPPGEVTFRWEAVEGASGYALRVVTPSFAEAGRIVADTLLRADTLGAARSYGCRIRLETGDYEWSVEAFNGAYATQPCIMRLSVVEIPPTEEPETPEP